MPRAQSIILGGLPVVVDISFGKDSDTPNGPGDYWSEIDAIYWRKKDGTAGSLIPQHIIDRAEAYDYGLATTIEYATESLIWEQHCYEIFHKEWLKPHRGDNELNI